MARVLIVEDEELLRDTLARFLAREGHDVIAAANGREAFDQGLSASPDVLIADWMLKNHIHGLHVSDTLKAVNPSLHTILITSFPSADLVAESDRSGVLQLLEKPFHLRHLQDAVDRAIGAGEPSGQRRCIAAVEVDGEGRIRFASPRALELFDALEGDHSVTQIDQVLPDSLLDMIEMARVDWITAQPVGGNGASWLVRARECGEDGQWLLVVVPEEERESIADPRVRILLDHQRRPECALPDLGPVVVIERDDSVRRLLVSQVERVGALCYPTDDLPGAVKLLAAEPRTHAILLELALAGDEVEKWIGQIKRVRPEAIVIGIGGEGCEEDLLDLGFYRFLHKPWRMQDLLEVIAR